MSIISVGCAKPVAPGEVIASKQQRITQAAPQADLDAAVTGGNDFAFDVYRQVRGSADNVVFSPLSLTTALAMTYGGARGTTETAFETVLHQTLPQANYHRAMNRLEAALTSRGVGRQGKNGQPFQLTLLNQLFSQKGFSMEQAFVDLLGTEYGADVRLLDFVGATEAARVAINAWVSGNTGGLIPELLHVGDVDADTRLTLVNAVSFNAAWATKFDPHATADGPFHLRDGSTRTVKLMASEGVEGGLATVDGTLVVELPYDGGEVSMVLLMPASGQLEAFEQGLDGAAFARYVAAVQPQSVALRMPKFSLQGRTSVKDTLTALGLGVAFSPAADFSGISTSEALQVQDVLHEAVVKTDEAGTEAAAATAVIVGKLALPQYTDLDRPFVFVIRDVATGAALFVGRVAAP
jgi:serpin B